MCKYTEIQIQRHRNTEIQRYRNMEIKRGKYMERYRLNSEIQKLSEMIL